MLEYCTDSLNTFNQERNSFGFGWAHMNSSYVPPNGYLSVYNAFQYKDDVSLQGLPIKGKLSTYEGNGYVYEMRGKLSYIQGNLSVLRNMNWVDRQTRAILFEFSAYNPNINLVMVSTILVEFSSTGSILTTARFDPLNLFSDIGSQAVFKVVCQIILIIFIVYFTIKELIEITKQGLKIYLNEFWTFIEWSIILCAFISFRLSISRRITANQVLDFFKTTKGYGYMKLQSANESNQMLTYLLGLCSALGTLKFLKLLRFNRGFSFLGKTLRSCFGELISYSMIFFLIWISFVQLMYVLYSSYLEGYCTIIKSMETAFQVMLGKFDVSIYSTNNNQILGPLIFAAYNVTILFFALNIFISIITESFDKIRNESKKNSHLEFDLMDHISEILNKKIKNNNSPSPDRYKNHLAIFSNRVNRLIRYFIRVKFFL